MKASLFVLAVAGLVAAQDFPGLPECAVRSLPPPLAAAAASAPDADHASSSLQSKCIEKSLSETGCKAQDIDCICKKENQDKLKPKVAPCIKECKPEDLGKAQAAGDFVCVGRGGSGSGSGSSSMTHTTGAHASHTSSAGDDDDSDEPSSTGATSTSGAGSTSTRSSAAGASSAGALPVILAAALML